MENYNYVNSLEIIINDVKKCLDAEAYFSALSTALIIPDICGALLYPNEIHKNGNTRKCYIKWFDNNVYDFWGKLYSEKFNCDEIPMMNGTYCYELRNKILHEGHDEFRANLKVVKEITEFVLGFNNDRIQAGNTAGKEYEFDNYNSSTGDVPYHYYLYVGVGELCTDLVNAAKCFLNNYKEEYEEQLTRLKINYHNGKINKNLFIR